MKTVTPIIKKRYKTDSEGIIYIQIIENRKKSYSSLKIKIPVKYWNDKTGRVRKNDSIDYKGINKLIEEKITELQVTPLLNKKSGSFTGYFQKWINRISNAGSKEKYQQVYNKLYKYQKDISFEEIDVDFIYGLRKYMLKTMSTNTCNHYLKLIKQVLNSAIEENITNYYRHPFTSIKFNTEKIQKTSLTEKEIKKILSCQINNTDTLYDIRNKFIFQVFAQGMRVSDVMLLKWSNIKSGYLDYKMFKTGHKMSVLINNILYNVLIDQLKDFMKEHNIVNKKTDTIEDELKQLKNERDNILRREYNITSGFDLVTPDMARKAEGIINDIEVTKEQLFLSYKGVIRIISKDNNFNNNFVFDFLKGTDIEHVKDYSKLTDSQYKILKNKSIVYNRHLKRLQKYVGLDTTLKSHLSRHSYASLLLSSDVDLFLISQSLGHQQISITEKYLSGFDNKKTGVVNKAIAARFGN